MPPPAQQLAEGLTDVVVVVDDDHAPRRRERDGAGERRGPERLLRVRSGELDREGAALVQPVAGHAHRAAVEPYQAAHQAQADAEPTAAALLLHEHLEDLVQQLGGDAAPAVAHGDTCVGLVLRAGELDDAPRLGVARGVVQQVREHLREPHRVRDDLAGRLEELDAELVPTLLDRGLAEGDGLGHDVVQPHPLGSELNLPGVDARQVEQVVDQAGEVTRLSFDGLRGALDAGFGRVTEEQLEHAEAVHDGSERVTQLMGEHGQELVLTPIGLRERPVHPGQLTLGALELGDGARQLLGLARHVCGDPPLALHAASERVLLPAALGLGELELMAPPLVLA